MAVEISEDDYAFLQKARKAGDIDVLSRAKGVLDTLYTDPDNSLEFQKMLKKKFPAAQIPQLDIVEREQRRVDEKLSPVLEENKKLKERLDRWETDHVNREEEGKLRSTLDQIKNDYKFTDDGMQKVVDRMKSMNNPDAESAAAWVKSKEPRPDPVRSSNILPETLNLYGSAEVDEQYAELHRDPRKWQDKEIAKMLNEFADAA